MTSAAVLSRGARRFAPAAAQFASRFLRVSAVLKEVVEIETKEQFQEKVLESKSPVVVDFYAVWCAPCKTLGPILEEVTEENKMLLAKVNIDHLSELAMDYDVSVVPTVIGIKNGEKTGSFLGLEDKEYIQKFVSGLSS